MLFQEAVVVYGFDVLFQEPVVRGSDVLFQEPVVVYGFDVLFQEAVVFICSDVIVSRTSCPWF